MNSLTMAKKLLWRRWSHFLFCFVFLGSAFCFGVSFFLWGQLLPAQIFYFFLTEQHFRDLRSKNLCKQPLSLFKDNSLFELLRETHFDIKRIVKANGAE